MIEFANFSRQEKVKQIKFLGGNNIEFQKNDAEFTASFKMQKNENIDLKREILSKTPPKKPPRSILTIESKLSRSETLLAQSKRFN